MYIKVEILLEEINRKKDYLKEDIPYLDNAEQDVGYATALEDIERFILLQT